MKRSLPNRKAIMAAVVGLFVAASVVLSQTGGGFDLSFFTIDGGGGSSAGGGFTLSGVIGQPDPGVLSGGPYTLQGGFYPSDVTLARTAVGEWTRY